MQILELILICLLIWLSIVDIRKYKIPNWINLLIFLIGLWWSKKYFNDLIYLNILISGGIIVLLSALSKAYEISRQQVGFGMGDVKLIGALVPWVGPSGIIWLIFIASSSALVFLFPVLVFKGASYKNFRLPFGPFLSAACVCIISLQQHGLISRQLW